MNGTIIRRKSVDCGRDSDKEMLAIADTVFSFRLRITMTVPDVNESYTLCFTIKAWNCSIGLFSFYLQPLEMCRFQDFYCSQAADMKFSSFSTFIIPEPWLIATLFSRFVLCFFAVFPPLSHQTLLHSSSSSLILHIRF